ncbi:hypothetical protein [Ferrimonas balearica]|uniref:hypothetical protein n=1 Tax=Ferrimonas balearica TaxID=44012 RepID=UPI001C9904FD|nr:hypothetical protein [Ferrimonas balearica]MBY5991466.1 hypothetical protein [Ferrimonas balearica]
MLIFTCPKEGVRIPYLPSASKVRQFRRLTQLAEAIGRHPNLGTTAQTLFNTGDKSLLLRCQRCGGEGQVLIKHLLKGTGRTGPRCRCLKEAA